jgi:peptide/nickel transport system permease protein
MRRLNLALGSVLIGSVMLAALVSFFWLPYDPNRIDFSVQLQPPSSEHWLGTDNFGRDLFSRLLVGARTTLYVGFIAVGIALSLGCLIGALAGYLAGLIDELFMRVADTLYAFPPLLMAILLAAIYGPGTLTAMVAIGIATVPVFARLMRASVLSLKSQEFVEAGRALGARNLRILARHILPNAVSPIVVQASLSLAVAILAEAALSFLGLGTPPRTPSWGSMLREAQGFMMMSPYPALVPGLAIVVTVLGWSLLGDGLRDYLDPRSRR